MFDVVAIDIIVQNVLKKNNTDEKNFENILFVTNFSVVAIVFVMKKISIQKLTSDFVIEKNHEMKIQKVLLWN